MLAIQATSEIHFNTTPQASARARGDRQRAITFTACCCIRLLAVDAGRWRPVLDFERQIWTRGGRRSDIARIDRELSDKRIAALDIHRRCGHAAAYQGLGGDMRWVIARAISLLFMPVSAEQHFHVIAESMHDRKLVRP